MRHTRSIKALVSTSLAGWHAILSLIVGGFCSIHCLAQSAAPIADPVERGRLPAEISELSVIANAELAYLFEAEDGINVAHLVGHASISIGDPVGQTLSAREAVVWITPRLHEGRQYQQLDILLWQDAEIIEPAGTISTGPAFFVTMNTFGSLVTNADDVALQSSESSAVYQQGERVRQAAVSGLLGISSATSSLRVVEASGLSASNKPTPKQKPKPVLQFRAGGKITGPISGENQQLITAVGGVYLSRGTPGNTDYLEIRATSLAIFIPPDPVDAKDKTSKKPGLGGELTAQQAARQRARDRRRRRSSSQAPSMTMTGGEVEVEAAYIEGDVIMSQGPNVIRASRIYYDFLEEKAIILDAVVRTSAPGRNIPLYLRAKEIRQLAANQYTASHAQLTTSEFHTPHYHLGAQSIELINRTPGKPTGGSAGLSTGSFRIEGATLNIGNTPVFYWPSIRGNIDTSETALRSVRTGFSDDFGMELETGWHAFNVLGLDTPAGFDTTLHLDYFSERGPAIGLDADYTQDRYFGHARSYLISDSDKDNLGDERITPSEKDVRGRLLIRHRQFLEDDWQMTLEISYISDETFLEEFFESEFDRDKEQETLLYLKKQRDNWAFTALVQGRILDFETQTERLPDFGFFLLGEPISQRSSWFSENRLGLVRYRADSPSFRELIRNGNRISSGTVSRIDSRQEITSVLDLGPIRFVPFGVIRGTAWDDSPLGGGVTRAFGSYGVRGSMYLSKVYPDVHSSLFDLNGIKHIIKPDLTVWASHSSRDSHELFPFDQTVEGVSEVDGISLGVRQRWQTKRGYGDHRRTVDVVTLDVESGFFNGASGNQFTNGFVSFSRPERSIARNFINSSLIWRVNDRTAIVSDVNYDINDGEVDVLNASLVVERSPRLSYLLGYRFIEESNSNLLGIDFNYKFSPKHSIAIRERFDLEESRTLDFTIALIRKLPRWFSALSFNLDEAEDDFGVSLSLWPEGLPQAVLGSRRFTGLATTGNAGQ